MAARPKPSRPRSSADPTLVARAERPKGMPDRLTRRNTRPGTPERQAVNRATYLRRRADLGPGETVRDRLGHGLDDRVMLAFYGPPARAEEFDDLSRAEARRLGRYHSLVEVSFDQPGSAAERAARAAKFQKTVSRWAPFRGQRLLADPDALAALLTDRLAAGLPIFIYERRGRR
ncbi:MAG: hypothetical protein ACRD0B_00180 [Acidimicrobiales bacterium]